MSLELSKKIAAVFLDSAKQQRSYVHAQMGRELAQARNYYRNYETALKRAAKYEQEVLDWDQTVADLKGYEPDREMPGDLEELTNKLRVIISKGKDEELPEEEGN